MSSFPNRRTALQSIIDGLHAKGYEITDLWVDHIFPYNVRRYQQHQYVKAWPFTVMPQAATRWLERRFGWHLCVTAQVPGQVIAP
ncbi:MAG: hypothetical protein IIC82_08355 [Chloroflexi bacterium]|nr:hypothetical protein [Chloroflexota bacterium]